MLQAHQLKTRHLGPIDFDVGAGQSISISGPSGSGKSLLLRAIADLDPHEGDIQLFDRQQQAVSAPLWRQQTGYLSANPGFWEDTVEQQFGEYNQEKFDRFLSALNLDNNIKQQSIVRLSSGEQQRLSLIRLLLNQPKALLLDEPTSHLDKDSEQKAETLIRDYQQQHQCPAIWVSHDESQQQRVASQHYRLRDGQLVEVKQ